VARIAHPWFWEERNGWYVNRNGQRHFLGDHPPDAPDPRKTKGKWNAPEAIRTAFHALMASPAEPILSAPEPPQNPDGLTVGVLFEKYLDWCEKHREKRTYDGYVWHLQRFCDHLKGTGTLAAELPALDLRPFHVNEWLDAHEWGQTYRRNAIAAIKRAYAWGEEEGHLDNNPLRKLKKPMPKRREQFIKPEDWVSIRDSYKKGDPFREFLEFCWETGARPFEARSIEARHVNIERKLIAIPPEEAKGRKRWRVIRLEGRALEIVEQRIGEGKLFTNRDGQPWTSYAINCRFCRLKEKLGTKHCAYAFRHGFCQRLLETGIDPLAVAELMGHADGQMISRVYSHMNQADQHLRAALKKATGSGEAEVAKP
jgi:integrase